MLALPGFLLLLGAGWSRLKPAWLSVAAPALWVLSGIVELSPVLAGTARISKRSDRQLARDIASEFRPGDAIVFGPLSRPPLEYYAQRNRWWDSLGWKGSFPACADDNPAGVVPTPLDSASAYYRQALALRRQWEANGIRQACILAVAYRPTGTPPPGTPGSGSAAWPVVPAPPPAQRRLTDANQIDYPMSLLVAALVGLKPVASFREYRQDWVAGDRVVVRINRADWVPEDSLPRLEVRR
jgi:hypothetical protein